MTSSEKRTESRDRARTKKRGRNNRGNEGSGRTSASSANARRSVADVEDREEPPKAPTPGLPAPVLWMGLLFLLLGGWLAILQINRWQIGPPVFFLCTGWLAVLLTGRFLWTAGMAAAEADNRAVEEEFWRPEGELDELMREKRSLLKAIKEIEFDYQMGKMSDKDAKELSTFYRARAIEIIKAIERHQDDGQELSVNERIERELRARLSVHHAEKKGKRKARVQAERADASAGTSANDGAGTRDGAAEEPASDDAASPSFEAPSAAKEMLARVGGEEDRDRDQTPDADRDLDIGSADDANDSADADGESASPALARDNHDSGSSDSEDTHQAPARAQAEVGS